MQLLLIDAFAEAAFRGNPAYVAVVDAFPEAAWMQQVAREMNLSETAFVVPKGPNEFDLRWFTPAAEVDLCGHATLASAHALWTEYPDLAGPSPVQFHTRSGTLTCSRDSSGRIAMDFPASPSRPISPPPDLLPSLSLGDDQVEGVYGSTFDLLVHVGSPETLRSLAPNFQQLAKVDTRGLIVTAVGDSDGLDFISRFFAPRHNVNEDPVTGSAHCCLGPFWADRLGKSKLRARQVSARGGNVGVSVAGDRVTLSGSAVTVLAGKLRLV